MQDQQPRLGVGQAADEAQYLFIAHAGGNFETAGRRLPGAADGGARRQRQRRLRRRHRCQEDNRNQKKAHKAEHGGTLPPNDRKPA
ncbi:MAG: hypothetical protein QF582_05280 [Alphaproteobacteria bacterium]|nr:hypothetical protein [Alphaproteobacteria bacterium]